MFNEDIYLTGDGNEPSPTFGKREFSGQGFIILNIGQDRNSYIENCYRTNTVTIITTLGDIIKNCAVPKRLWNDIVFPDDVDSKGSLVIWLNMYRQDLAMILAVLEKKQIYSKKTEQTIIEQKITEDCSYTLNADGLNAIYNQALRSAVEEIAPLYQTRVLHAYTEAIYDLYVQGKIQIQADDSYTIKAKNGITLNVVDDNDTTKNTIIQYLLGQGFSYSDEFKNIVKLNSDGLSLSDNNKNTIQTTSSGILIQNDDVTLKQILTLIVQAVQPIVVLQGNNPLYDNLTQALEKINQLLSS